MDMEQFKQVQQFVRDIGQKVESKYPFYVSQLSDHHEDRTLLFGYDCDRNTWHVYCQNGIVKLHVYDFEKQTIRFEDTFSSWDELIPNKRLYPESCDSEFCGGLVFHKVHMPFLPFSEDRYERVKDLKFHGEVHVED